MVHLGRMPTFVPSFVNFYLIAARTSNSDVVQQQAIIFLSRPTFFWSEERSSRAVQTSSRQGIPNCGQATKYWCAHLPLPLGPAYATLSSFTELSVVHLKRKCNCFITYGQSGCFALTPGVVHDKQDFHSHEITYLPYKNKRRKFPPKLFSHYQNQPLGGTRDYGIKTC